MRKGLRGPELKNLGKWFKEVMFCSTLKTVRKCVIFLLLLLAWV